MFPKSAKKKAIFLGQQEGRKKTEKFAVELVARSAEGTFGSPCSSVRYSVPSHTPPAIFTSVFLATGRNDGNGSYSATVNTCCVLLQPRRVAAAFLPGACVQRDTEGGERGAECGGIPPPLLPRSGTLV